MKEQSKFCGKCKATFPITNFSYDKRGSYGRTYYCKTCAAANARKNYKENHSDRRVKAKIRNKKHNKASKLWAIEYKGGKCADCNNVYPYFVYDFHHVNPEEKDYVPSHVIGRKNREIAMKELDKCVLLCSNCHRMRHYI